ncbi:ricin-type beta-trefoil lectin domain protein [Streptomyces sp. PSAA01]|uniref:ricin-type beta-trefoil lectin domain protein n=1 Tax=Streptomyces sp. PSAA01 TaxID=2912762 RepID=UPI001F1CFDA7|nr:ricin-type beta-trefoil lectin domain protein [Streptomyces sp. PSAA01]MCG0287206.1 ricin-type beta-trefoil lectin domain protein [Streptomyces sp. PSAA01]
MTDQHGTEPNATAGQRPYAQLSDAELTERIRSGAPTALPATQQLRERHLPAVLSYARLCARTRADADQLADLSFGLAAQETCRGIDPWGPWRHHLLLLVQRVAATWAEGNRAERLDPPFAEWLGRSGITADGEAGRRRPQERSAILGGFLSLSARTRDVLWYSVVDEDPDTAVATFAGLAPHTVPALRETARDALREAWLRTHLERGGEQTCQGFRGLIEAAVRPDNPRRCDDLDRHLSACPSCAGVYGDLIRMDEDPRTVIADGLLGWGGAAYVTAGPVSGLPSVGSATPSHAGPRQPGPPPAAAPPTPYPPAEAAEGAMAAGVAGGAGIGPNAANAPMDGGSAGRWRRPTWTGSRPPATTALIAVAAVAAVAATVAVLVSGGDEMTPAGGRNTPPPVSATATPSAQPTTDPPAPTKRPQRPPNPGGMTEPPTTAPATPPPSTAPPSGAPIPGGTYTLVINADSGLCLDIRDQRLEKRTDAVLAPCAGTDTQRWRLDSEGLLHTEADPDFCLDSRGDTDRGVGIWPCSSADGDNGENLRFVVDRQGLIRPHIAPDFAVTPDDDETDSQVELRSAEDRNDQRWNAGYTDTSSADVSVSGPAAR